MYQIAKARLGELFARIAESGELILPLESSGKQRNLPVRDLDPGSGGLPGPAQHRPFCQRLLLPADGESGRFQDGRQVHFRNRPAQGL